MKSHICFITLFTVMFTTGCIPLNSHEVTDLKGEVSQMQIQYKELQRNHADLYAKVDSTCLTLDRLNASIQELEDKVSVLNQALQDAGIASDKRDERSRTVLPSSLYQNAYSDYSMKKFSLAYSEFQSFVDKYPNAELAPQAQFYMGECLYSQNQWEKAIEEYKKVEQNYKKIDLAPSARFKIASCYEMLNKKLESIDIFSSIVKDFPQSSQSLAAKEKIKKYKNAQKK